MLKVLHLVSGSISGGAARGSYWLHRGLRELGVDSFLLANSSENHAAGDFGNLSETTTQKLKFSLIQRLGSLPKYFYPNRKPWIFNTGFEGIDFTKHPAYREADIIHLHWINGLVAMRTLRKVEKPIVWTLRDMWPFTGGCHYSMGCVRYENGCGKCPQLGSDNNIDLSRIVVINKKRFLSKKIKVVGISQWLTECASHSEIFRDFDVRTISNNVDASEFHPNDQTKSRKVLGLPIEKNIILIGAQTTNDYYKGFDLFVEALQKLNMMNIHIVVFGNITPEQFRKIPNQKSSLGFITNNKTMRIAYSAADLFVAPSRMEAFGKTLVESMACGTPVVCFNATGPADIVEHQITGYKAKPFDTSDLAFGIEWVLSRDSSQYKKLSNASRERVEKLFDSKVVAKKYIDLYERMLE